MKRATFLCVLMLIAGSLAAQTRIGATNFARLDTTVTTAWIGITIPTGTISRSVYSMEIEDSTAGTVYFALRSQDTSNAATRGGWRYSGSVTCITAGSPGLIYLEQVWTGTLWLKASTSSNVKIRIW